MTQPAQAFAPPVPSEDGVRKRKLRNYVLDVRYQLRFTLIMVALSALLTTGLGWLVYHFVSESSRVVVTGAAATLSDEALQLFKADIARNDHYLLLALVGFGVILCVVMAAYGIVLTHKVAGPLFKISLYMNKIRDGRLGKVYDLRKGDQLIEFFETFKQMHESLARRAEDEVALLERAIADADKHGAQAAADALRALKRQKEESLA